MSASRRKHDPGKLHLRIKESFDVLRVPLPDEALDAALSQAEKQRWSHLDFLVAIIGPLRGPRPSSCYRRDSGAFAGGSPSGRSATES